MNATILLFNRQANMKKDYDKAEKKLNPDKTR